MNYKLGDKLELTIDAFNKVTKEIVWQKGTEAEITFIKGDVVTLKFPDGLEHPHNKNDIPMLFINKSCTGKVLYNTVVGYGTPPKAFQPYLPNGTNWKKNYVWKFSIELEEREDKETICPECTSELKNLENINELGQVLCENCKLNVVPYNLKVNINK